MATLDNLGRKAMVFCAQKINSSFRVFSSRQRNTTHFNTDKLTVVGKGLIE